MVLLHSQGSIESKVSTGLPVHTLRFRDFFMNKCLEERSYMPEEGDYMPEEHGYMPEEHGDMLEENGYLPKEPGYMAEESGYMI